MFTQLYVLTGHSTSMSSRLMETVTVKHLMFTLTSVMTMTFEPEEDLNWRR